MAEFDLSTMSVSEMNALRLAIENEIKKRTIVESSPQKIEEIAAQYLSAVGREQGSEWVQPEGAHDAYPAGYVITHSGKEWRSLVGGNVWEPGVSAWREVVEDGATPPKWFQPLGAHDSYAQGDRVTFEGVVWTSQINGNVWPPGDNLWWLPESPEVEEPTVEEPPVDEGTDPLPEEPVEPEPETIPEFEQPTGSHNTYSKGDKVTFEGSVYESVIDNNAYSPTAYPAGWRQIS